MKTSLDILPKDKQEELHRVVEIIREEFKPEMIILFGSHARGNLKARLSEEMKVLA